MLSPADMYALQQQAIQLGQAVFERKIDVSVAAQELFQELQKRLGSNAHLLNNLQPLMQQLVDVVRSFLQYLPSNAATRSASGVHADLFALAQQYNFNSLDDVIAAFPQYAVTTTKNLLFSLPTDFFL